jgi:hypothetical protein
MGRGDPGRKDGGENGTIPVKKHVSVTKSQSEEYYRPETPPALELELGAAEAEQISAAVSGGLPSETAKGSEGSVGGGASAASWGAWGRATAGGLFSQQPAETPDAEQGDASADGRAPAAPGTNLGSSSWSSLFFLNMNSGLGGGSGGGGQGTGAARSEAASPSRPATQARGPSPSGPRILEKRMNMRRTDFALQESPLEAPSEYLAGFRAHFSYW